MQNFSTFEEIDLFREICALEENLILASENLLYHNIVLYAYNLAKKFSAFYNNVNILNEENENKKLLRLKLIQKYIETQKLIFEVLAIILPTKM